MMTAEDNLKADLKEYKIRINPSLKATLTWTRDLVFGQDASGV